MINQISSLSPSPLNDQIGSQVSKAGQSFADAMKKSLQEVNQAQNDGDKSIQALQSGEAEHLHEVMLTVEKADLSLRMLVQMRNKAQSAYEEIMRMQL